MKTEPMVETFVYGNWEWWVRPARQLVADRTPVEIEVVEFAPTLHTLVAVNASDTDGDLSDPVLVSALCVETDGHARLIIDGWHRLNVIRDDRRTDTPRADPDRRRGAVGEWTR